VENVFLINMVVRIRTKVVERKKKTTVMTMIVKESSYKLSAQDTPKGTDNMN